MGPDLTFNGERDAFIAKVQTDGTGLVYCGYIGGADFDEATGIAVDSANSAYIAGRTVSSEASFPVTIGPDLTSNGGIDAFVVKIRESSCTLVCNAIVLDKAVVNASVQFTPTTVLAHCNEQLRYEWSFGDNTATSTLPNPKHTYTNAGSYGWKLTVRGPESTVCMKSGTIIVEANCAVPTIEKQPDTVIISTGRTATLSVTATGTGLSYQWYEGNSGNLTKPVGTKAATFTTPVLTNNANYWGRVTSACGKFINSNTANVIVNGTTTLVIEVIDPNCDFVLSCEGAFLKEITTGNVFVDPDINKLANAKITRRSVVADGVTLLLLRVRTNQRVAFKLEGSPQTGTLLTRQGVVKGGEAVVDPEGGIAYAVYKAPLDRPDNADQAKIAATTATGNGSKAIDFLRPPVVLVHGVWSSREAWEKDGAFLLADELRDRAFTVCNQCVVDYSSNSAGSFDPTATSTADQVPIQALMHSTNEALRDVRWNLNAAVTQVDVVGHSMGGLVARARVASTFDTYLKLKNYKKGDFHKIITIGTPHLGSELGDWLVAHRCDTIRVDTDFGPIYTNVENIINAHLGPIGPAFFGFQTSSLAITKIGATAVPAHAIVGIAPDSSVTERLLNSLIKGSGTNPPNYDSNKTTDIDTILDPQNKRNHDTIVPTKSQEGGVATAFTSITGIVHAGNVINDGETSSRPVWSRIIELLKMSPGSSTFNNFPAFTPRGTYITYPQPACTPVRLTLAEAALAEAPTTTVAISPASNTLVKPGDIVQITFNVTNGSPISGAFFTIDKELTQVEGAGPFSISYVVPSTRAGRINIFAMTYGSAVQNYSASTYLTAKPNAALSSIIASPNNLLFQTVGENTQLKVIGQFVDNTQVALTNSTAGTTYAVQGGMSNIVSVSPEGFVEARGNGQATVIVTNAGKTAMVKVYVSSTGVPNSAIISVSAANYTNTVFAPEEIVSVFGTGMATARLTATTVPLPTSLGGATVKVTDSTGTERLAPLFFISPTQINYQIPPGTAPGAAMVRIDRPNDFPSLETLLIDATAPGLFTANASGNGVAAALALRVKSNGMQSYEPIARFDTTINRMVATPIDLGPVGEQVFLILYGTGLKFRSSLAAVTVKLGGVDAAVSFAQAQGSLTGLDQVNALIPRSLIGRGEVDVVLTVDSKTANSAKVNIK